MIAALLLLTEASAACAPRLGGDAMLVRPVGTFERVPFERLGPTESVVRRPTEIQQVAAEDDAEAADGQERTDQCAAVPISIA